MSQTRKTVLLQLFICVCLSVFLSACAQNKQEASTANEEKLVKVRFGVLPYGDHTFAIIGVKKGWFEEVGIDLDLQPIKIENVVPYLKNGTLDVASCPPGILFASYETAPNMVSFVLSDLFQGFCIMAQPDRGYKGYKEFTFIGKKPEEAVRLTVAQIKGKTFAYPAEAAIKPFIDLALKKGNLTTNDFTAMVLDDPLTVNAMRKKQADFQVGGVPSHVLLQREGFKPILTCRDLATTAKPSPNSPELASILEDGWATTREYYEKNHDTILRLASVNYRMMLYMNEHERKALQIHMPYLSQITGEKFTINDGRIIYEDLDPFCTYDQQKKWFHDPNDLYYYKNVNGAILNNYIAKGIYKNKPPTVDQVMVAPLVYDELEKYKAETDKLIAKLNKVSDMSAHPQTQLLYARALALYADYDYFDSARLTKKVCDQLGL